MYVNFLLAATNIGLDPLFIFGLGPFPRLGVVGAAIATNIAYLVALVAYLVLSFRHPDCIEYRFWRNFRYDRALFGRLMRYGVPSGMQMMAEIAAFSVFLFLIGRLGTQSLAATNLALNINMLSFIPMLGVGTAVMTLVGKRIGEGRPQLAVRTTWLAAATTAIYMLVFGVLFVAFPEVILRPFTRTGAEAEMAAIRDEVVLLLRFVAVYTFFDGMAIVFAFAVRGAGDTRFAFVFTLISAWLLMAFPTWLLLSTGYGGLYAAWAACSAYVVVLGVGFFLRFQQGKWQSMRVIEATAAGAG
jgi:MATE family multidrug resistance protein